MSITSVSRELLVRYLDAWVVGALRRSRRVTFVQAWSGQPDVAAAEAALRVFTEFGDRMRGRQVSFVLVAPQTGELGRRLDALQTSLVTPAELGVYVVAGDPAGQLAATLSAAGASAAPLLAHVDTDGAVPLSALRGGRPAEILSVTPTGDWDARRRALVGAGFPLGTGVDLVAAATQPGPGAGSAGERLVSFGTSSARSLETFKNELWAVDEFAGVRLRDPTDPQGRPLEITLTPDPGPLRRELLAHLRAAGARTVTQLRHFTLTDTVYRVADTERALTTLLAAGAVTRQPEHGRLAGDVVIRPVS